MNLLKKVKSKFLWKLNDLKFALNINVSLEVCEKIARILVYHGIDECGSTAYNTRFISEKMLEKQIKYFKEKGKILSLEEYYDEQLHQTQMTLCLTFDDGYKNGLTRALPILEKYQVPSTFFITGIRSLNQSVLWTDIIDLATPFFPKKIEVLGKKFRKNYKKQMISVENGENIKHFLQKKSQAEIEMALEQLKKAYPFSLDVYHSDYYQTLSEEEIQLLAKNPLISIGAHGVFHTDLTVLSPEECLAELQNCKHYLENLTQKKVNAIAFPFGNYNETVLKMCEKAGFSQFLALDINPNVKHKQVRERFGVNPFISFENQILAIHQGKYL